MRPMRKNFFAAALQVGFNGIYVGGGHNEDHADAHIEGLQQFVGFSIFPSVARNLKMGGTGQDARSIWAFTPAGRTRGKLPGIPPPVMCARPGDPSARNNIFERGCVTQVGL